MTNLSALVGGSSVAVGQIIQSPTLPVVAGQTYALCNGGSVLRSTYPALSTAIPVGSQIRPLINWQKTIVPPTNNTLTDLAFDGTTYVGLFSSSANFGGIYTSTDLVNWTLRLSISLSAGDLTSGSVTYLGGTPAWVACWKTTTNSGQNFMATASTATGTWTASSPITSTNMYVGRCAKAVQVGAKTILPIYDTTAGGSANLKCVVTTNSGSTWSTVNIASNQNTNYTVDGSTTSYTLVFLNWTGASSIVVLFLNTGYVNTAFGPLGYCSTSADWSTAGNWAPLTISGGNFNASDAIITPTNGALLIYNVSYGVLRATTITSGVPNFGFNLIPNYFDPYSSTLYSGAYSFYPSGNSIYQPNFIKLGTYIYTLGINIANTPITGIASGTLANSTYWAFSKNQAIQILLVSADDGLTWQPVCNPGQNQQGGSFLGSKGAFSAAWTYNSSNGYLICPAASLNVFGYPICVNIPEWTDSTSVYLPHPSTLPASGGMNNYMRIA
jgi:hypothetical protein